MRLVASDIITQYRPSPCDLRVWLQNRGEPEREPTEFEKVLYRLGERHEKAHLATLAAYTDFSTLSEDERIQRTLAAVAAKVPVLYQPTFRVLPQIAGTEVEIVGQPDFLILDGERYIVRDAKMARRIDPENHPEILLQVQLYGWLFEKSCGVSPKALQVFGGTKEVVPIPYDGGVSALAALERLLAVKQLRDEPYEPVGWTKCGACGFNERCWNRAEKSGDVALVPDVDQSLARTLNAMGVRTRKELLSAFDAASLSNLKRPFGKTERRVGKTAERILQFAEALERREEKVLAVPAIPQLPNFVMFDLEGMPAHLDELDKIYLWGAQVFGEKPSEFMPAVSGFGPDGDREGWLAFLENAKRIFDRYGDIPFVHWHSYEKKYLSKYVQRYGDLDGVAARVVANLLDLFTVTKESVIAPVPSFSLKVIEQHVGYKRQQDEFGGQWAMARFIEATETSDEGKRKELMDEILAYNKEDLEATWAVFQWLRAKIPPVGEMASS
ncbi:MAG TPA: TM0106 family RecB-like putative nuclease [Candidatus Acidoferrum sp.]|nr:TM0106 family RecB-like putative nuclease [Candidatus Acidoferrum sp.]